MKLGIDGDPPALAAAKYHYFSNSIGGLNMQIVAETDRKVWIRYLSPWGSYPGIAALAVPPSVRRTILSTWHPRNGELLGCPRLGWVATKFVSEGHPYDEGYFIEHERDLSPEERFRVEHVERSPEFIPEHAPRLDPAVWPEIRILKGGYNYGVDYVRHTVQIIESLSGVTKASHIVESAMKLLAVQYAADLAATLGRSGTDPLTLAETFAAIFASYRNPCRVRSEGDRVAVLEFENWAPFDTVENEQMLKSLFAFFDMMVRVRNGHLSVAWERHENGRVLRIADEGKWIW